MQGPAGCDSGTRQRPRRIGTNKRLAPRFSPTTFSCKEPHDCMWLLVPNNLLHSWKPSDLPPLPSHPVGQTQMTHLVDTHTHTSLFHTYACMHARCLQPLRNQKFRSGDGDFANSSEAAGRIVQPDRLTSMQRFICPPQQRSDRKTKMLAQIKKQRRLCVVRMVDGCVRVCV